MALLSVVLPAYNEQQNIAYTTGVLSGLFEQNGIDYELIFVSDGSSDATYEEIEKAAAANHRVKGAQFSRNFGKEAGIFAGLELSSGDAVVVMDCDLQHPPETILTMWQKWQEGVEIVEGVKSDRGKAPGQWECHHSRPCFILCFRRPLKILFPKWRTPSLPI